MEVTIQRSVFRLSLQLDAVIDLRTPQAGTDLGLERWPEAMTDRGIARHAAARIRYETSAQADDQAGGASLLPGRVESPVDAGLRSPYSPTSTTVYMPFSVCGMPSAMSGKKQAMR